MSQQEEIQELRRRLRKERDSSTKSNSANADRRLRPAKILERTSYPDEQMSIWADLMSTDFVAELTSLAALKEYGKENPISLPLSGSLYANPHLRRTFKLNGDVAFENHTNTLTDDSNIPMHLRRFSRLTAESANVNASAQPPKRRKKASQPWSKPRADQFCVYNKGQEGKVPAYIIGYKAPHKFSLSHIKAGLQDMDFDEVVRLQKDGSPEVICRHVVAAVIAQTFSHKIQAGLEYGYVCTGKAFISPSVLHDNPSRVYYYLSVPEKDVGPTMGWTGNPSNNNRLHLTAVGQVLAFTLFLAAWNLDIWDMVHDSLLDDILEKDIPSSDFKPPTRSQNQYYHVSTVKRMSNSARVMYCNTSQDTSTLSPDINAGDDFDANIPSRSCFISEEPLSSGSKGKSREYCSQQCLLGLVKGGQLDRQCPNVSAYGQLDTQLGCESLHVHGSCGAPFKFILWSHGYTFVEKGTPVEFVAGLKHEELIYSHLTSIQGVYVPVLLGSLRLRRPFSYDGIAEIVHLMFMSYAGKTLANWHDPYRSQQVQKAEKSLQTIHELNVLQGDPIPGNMVEENGRIMFIDFERAELQPRRIPLGGISEIHKHKQNKGPKSRNHHDCFEREKQRMRNGLR
ncbi:uncharacterized protein BDW70DRAFT_170360 [Aspergillus foveolatus]|uniref:uncharacterized protein n=1 Tax=Aspergillus foveolatus TaxID=210207 RepID=UPI003CCE2B39